MQKSIGSLEGSKRLFPLIGIMTVIIVLMAASLIGSAITGCGGGDDDDSTAATPTSTPIPTQTPMPTATPTPTQYTGWGQEQIAWQQGGDWIDVAANENGELALAYVKAVGGRTYVAYVKRDTDGTWATQEKEVPASENNTMYNKSFVSTSIDNNGDVHIVYTDLGREEIYYNRYNEQAGSWQHSGRYPVLWGEDLIHPDIVTTPNDTKRYVIGQVKFGAGFNWDNGSGFQGNYSIPYWLENYECKTPRLALGPNGKVYLAMYDYRRYAGDPNPQIGFNEYDPTTGAWGNWVVPASMPTGTFPGYPAIAAGKNGTIHVAWFNWHAGLEWDQLMYCVRDAAGNWGSPEVLSSGMMMEEPHNIFYPCLAVNEDGVAMIAWATSMESEGKLRYRVKSPGGNWSAAAFVTTSEDQYYPSLTVSGKKFSLAWLDKRNGDDYFLYVNDYIP